MLPAVTLKEEVTEPGGTLRVDVVSGSSVLVLESETVVAPAGDTVFTLTVQTVLAPDVKVAGLHANEESVTGEAAGGAKESVTFCEMPFRVAKIVAF